MKIAAIICEYNPFHEGHAAQISLVRDYFAPEDVTVIALMSGDYVERGDVAVLPKYLRAEAGVRCGADLVIELPFPYSMGSAAIFADSAVSILDRLGGIDCLFFGSESGEIQALEEIAGRLTSEAFLTAFAGRIAENTSSPESYARMRSAVYEELFDQKLAATPNDILAIEYLIALKKRNSKIVPIAHKRIGNFSATAAREALVNGQNTEGLIPEAAREIFENHKAVTLSDLDRAIVAHFRTHSPDGISFCAENDLSLSCRLCRAAKKSRTVDEMIALSATKKYTTARLRRAILYGFLGVHQSLPKTEPLWTRLLGADRKGLDYLHKIRKTAEIPVLTKPADASEELRRESVYECEAAASSIYELIAGELPKHYGERPFILYE